MKINEKIRLLRQKKSLSQEAISEKLNMSTRNYASLERGEYNLSFKQVESIASVLNVNMLELMTYGDNEVAYIRTEDGQGFLISKTFPMTYEALKKDCEYLHEKIELLNTLLATQKELINRLEEELHQKTLKK